MGRVTVIHPDLGVGGAERLIVDASKALQECGHQVTIYTGYHNPKRCFQETRDGTLTTIALGQWIPRTLLGRFHAVMAYLKMIYIALYLLLFSDMGDLVLCDQVSACIPFIKLNFWRPPRVVFYCHFPDQLLTQRESILKTMYREPIDLFEEWSTSLADVIVVNSKFTQTIVRRTFKSLRHQELTVLYPCVDVNKFLEQRPSPQACDELLDEYDELAGGQKFIFLSLNRFERKKALASAIEALSGCLFKLKDIQKQQKQQQQQQQQQQDNENDKLKRGLHLIVAGGYDPRLVDSVHYYDELRQLVHDLELDAHVTFIESPSDEDKLKLLALCDAVVYTPENEHFGIVPLEAMAMSKPVVASASGGPLETIVDGTNGYLCARDDDNSFQEAMLKLYADQELSRRMGARGLERATELFSYEAFRERLNEICFASAARRGETRPLRRRTSSSSRRRSSLRRQPTAPS